MANRVAVIILNWNGEKLLREFLPSVVKNTNSELGRVVVVDNHSTDGSWVCLELLVQAYPRTIRRMVLGYAWNKSSRMWNGCCSRIISGLPEAITGRSR